MDNVHLDAVRQVETIVLPVSKTDPGAASVRRSWHCVCNGDICRPCPFHAAQSQLELLRRRFGDPNGQLLPQLPLFPTLHGQHASKMDTVGRIVGFLLSLGDKTEDAHANHRYGGHSFRVGGAMMLANLAIDTNGIMVMGRWASDTVRRYVGQAALTTVSSCTREALRRQRILCLQTDLEEKMHEAASKHLVKKIGVLRGKDLNGKYEELLHKVACMEDKLKARDNTCWDNTVLIRNLKTKAVHLVPGGLLGPSEAWVSVCGWRFCKSDYELIQRCTPVAKIALCVRCGVADLMTKVS